MTGHLAPVSTAFDKEPLFALRDSELSYLIGMLGSHFDRNDTLDRETLLRYVEEAGAL